MQYNMYDDVLHLLFMTGIKADVASKHTAQAHQWVDTL